MFQEVSKKVSKWVIYNRYIPFIYNPFIPNLLPTSWDIQYRGFHLQKMIPQIQKVWSQSQRIHQWWSLGRKRWVNPRWNIWSKRHTPPKNNHDNGKSIIWRCISYWYWGFSNVMLLFRGVTNWWIPLTPWESIYGMFNLQLGWYLFLDVGIPYMDPMMGLGISWSYCIQNDDFSNQSCYMFTLQ